MNKEFVETYKIKILMVGLEREEKLHNYELKIRRKLIEIAEIKEIVRIIGGENWCRTK